MHRFGLHPWLAAFLVLARLLVGPSAHAGAHPEHAHASADVAHAAVVASESCDDHESAGVDAGDTHAPVTAEEPSDCCQEGGCDCPCAHVSALVLTSVLPAHPPLTMHGSTLALSPLPPQRLTPLLRPPA